MSGKEIRIERILDRNTKKAVVVPLDHGVSMGPIPGIVDLKETVGKVAEGGATAVLEHKGAIPHGHRAVGRDVGLIVHMSASSSLSLDPNSRVLVCEVTEALKMGADAVSIHVNIGADTEADMLRDFGYVSRECREWGMPLLAMVYPRGQKIKDSFDVDMIKRCARIAQELGADIVKTSYTGDIYTFKEVTRGVSIPVLVAGGPQMSSDREVLQMVHDSIEAGGSGTSIGRNIFQHSNVVGITKAISGIVFKDLDVDEAMKLLK